MRKSKVAIVFMLCVAFVPAEKAQKTGSRVVLPNPKLLKCRSSECLQLLSTAPSEPKAVFPKQVIVDMNRNCIYGLTVLYDKSVRIGDVETAIDERYEKWADPKFKNSAMKLWRVEPEKFAIQLIETSRKEKNLAEPGTKQAIFLAFGGQSTCDLP